MESITQSNNWLHRLSNSVKIASSFNQNARAVEFRLEDYNGGKDRLIEDDVRAIFTNVILEISDSLDEKWLQRLVDSMITRLTRILYRRSRQAQWSFPEIPNPIMNESDKLLKMQHSLPSVLRQKSSTPTFSPRISQPERPNLLPSKATEVSPQVLKSNFLKSAISKATSIPQRKEDETAIPLPPKGACEGNNFTCPYCCLILSSSVAQNQHAWA